MKTIALYVIKFASTEDGRGWDYLPNANRYFTTEAKALVALKKEIRGHKDTDNWVTVKKNSFEAAFEKQWIVKEIIKVEA
jgi:hypothetical protein